MPKARRKTLLKDFEQLLQNASLADLQSVFDVCEIDARGGYDKLTALMMPACPDDLARWLVAQGADIHAKSQSGKSALHTRAFFPQYSLQVLIELGCDIHACCSSGTPLHVAAQRGNLDGIKLLLQAGAKVNEKNYSGDTPLGYALEHCQNVHIREMAPTAKLLLEAGAERTDKMKARVERIGQGFEWVRSGFNPDYLEETDAGLQQLYQLFDATPAPPRIMYDGHSRIVPKSDNWQDAHKELWDLLIPTRGPATTVQGEVIRIAGRIASELYTNGGGNWDREFRKMANAFLKLIASGNSLADEQIQSCREFLAELPGLYDADVLVQNAVAWVRLNPDPLPLGPVEYNR